MSCEYKKVSLKVLILVFTILLQTTLFAQNQNQNRINEILAVSVSDTAGDPVRITTGAYEQTETDILKQNVINLIVQRVYQSTKDVTGSFGLGWSTNLDERVILGTKANVQDIYDAYAEYLLELETNLKAMENQIKEDFFVEDPYSVVNEANIRIKTAEELLEKLNELKKEYEDTKKKTEEAEQELQMTKSRKERNKKAMFKGLGLYFEETGLDTVTYVDERGYPYLMYQHENYSNVWQSKDRDCVCVFENDEYTVYKGSVKKTCDYKGFIIRETDYYGNTIEYIRDEDEKIKFIKSSFGESFAVEYENNFIKKIVNERDPSENVLYYYEGDRMTGTKDTDGDYVSIGYDKHGLINSIGKNDGSAYTIIYDDQLSEGEILATQLVNEEGKSQRFEYNRKDKITAFIDRDGWKTVYHYNNKHRTTKLEKYDPDGNIVKNTEQPQNEKEFLWNDDGSVLECKENEKTIYRKLFNSKGQTIRYVDCRNEKEIIHDYEYDNFGNISKDSVKNNIKEMEYDSRNRLTKLIQNGKLLSNYEYEKDGKIHRINYSNNLVMEIEYNGRKDLIAITFTDNNNGKRIITEIEYDHHHMPLRVYKGDGNKRELKKVFTYTDEGWLLSSEIEGVKKTFDGYAKAKLSFEALWDIPDISNSDNDAYIYKDENGIESLKQKLFAE
ncbi:MAG: DUF6531 domain-containing protein [Treponema sp.]|nr:DUF6531 domain-containing protein [Treponema sp.]MDY5759039.1 DUF6531 domain-containing protein [Treponema sp.]